LCGAGNPAVDARYWERIGQDYEAEIFASALADTSGAIIKRLNELARPRGVAVDFGCGVGHYLPLLSKRFREVHGFDFAHALVDQARERTSRLKNVTVRQANLASARTKLPSPLADVGVCANVLISDDARMRRGILRTIAKNLAARGQLLLLVPSLESALFSSQQLIKWNRKLGHDESDAVGSGIHPARNIARGLVRIDGVPTKHYLREEIEVLLDDAGLAITSCDKAEYEWNTEFENPPRWMKAPGPWDWLFVAKHKAK
jgi:SAM-dependent methyltransferase